MNYTCDEGCCKVSVSKDPITNKFTVTYNGAMYETKHLATKLELSTSALRHRMRNGACLVAESVRYRPTIDVSAQERTVIFTLANTFNRMRWNVEAQAEAK